MSGIIILGSAGLAKEFYYYIKRACPYITDYIFVNDLVNFLVYVGDPVQLERQRIGKYVIIFLLLFLVIAYLLKKEYWRDVD